MSFNYVKKLNCNEISIRPLNFFIALVVSFLFDIVFSIISIPNDILVEFLFYFEVPISDYWWYPFSILSTCFYQYIALFLIILIVKRKLYIDKENDFGNENTFNLKLYKKDYFIASILMISYTLITYGWFDYILYSIPSEALESAIEYLNEIPVVVLLIESCIIAPIFEELLYRGVILNGLLNKYNYKKAIIYSSIIFGIAHLNLPQGINAFFLALIIGIVYYYTKSIYLCMVMHAANNIIVNFIVYPVSDFWSAVLFVLVPIIGIIIMKNCFKVLDLKKRRENQIKSETIF